MFGANAHEQQDPSHIAGSFRRHIEPYGIDKVCQLRSCNLNIKF